MRYFNTLAPGIVLLIAFLGGGASGGYASGESSRTYYQNFGGLSTNNITLPESGGDILFVNHGAINIRTIARIACEANATANIILAPGSSLDIQTLQLALNGGQDARIVVNPQSVINTQNLTLSENATLHFNITADSDMQQPPVRVSTTKTSLGGQLLVDSRALVASARIPLLCSSGRKTFAIPRHSLLADEDTDAALEWDADSSTLYLRLTRIPPWMNTDSELLVYAFTENYALRDDMRPTTLGDNSHLPQVRINEEQKLIIVFTPLRAEYLYEVQQSEDLVSWRTIRRIPGGSSEEIIVGADYGLHDASVMPQLFLRVKVSETPSS